LRSVTVDQRTSIRLGNFLSPVTRAERRSLLLVSAVGIVIEKTGLVPTKITTFGIVFSSTDRSVLLALIGGVVLYFLCAFAVYGWTDFIAAHRATSSERREALTARLRDEELLRDAEDESSTTSREVAEAQIRRAVDEWIEEQWGEKLARLWIGERFAVITRGLLEWVFPIVLGVYAATILIW
jgi:hypothetical protein